METKLGFFNSLDRRFTNGNFGRELLRRISEEETWEMKATLREVIQMEIKRRMEGVDFPVIVQRREGEEISPSGVRTSAGKRMEIKGALHGEQIPAERVAAFEEVTPTKRRYIPRINLILVLEAQPAVLANEDLERRVLSAARAAREIDWHDLTPESKIGDFKATIMIISRCKKGARIVIPPPSLTLEEFAEFYHNVLLGTLGSEKQERTSLIEVDEFMNLRDLRLGKEGSDKPKEGDFKIMVMARNRETGFEPYNMGDGIVFLSLLNKSFKIPDGYQNRPSSASHTSPEEKWESL